LDAVVNKAHVGITPDLVHGKAHDMWHQMEHRLARQGIDPRQYLQIAGKTEEDVIKEAEPDAEQALKREAVLAAIVESEGIGASDDELIEALGEAAQGAGSDKQLRKAFDKLKREGRDKVLREDVAMRKAVDLVAEHAKPVEAGRAEAREKIWTPSGAS
jgi:trigger factor